MDNGPEDLTKFVDAATTWRYWERRAVTRSSEESKRRARAHDDLLVAIDELFGDDPALPKSITCLTCGRQSFNPQDVKEGYCGYCHDWTSPPLARRPDALPADPS